MRVELDQKWRGCEYAKARAQCRGVVIMRRGAGEVRLLGAGRNAMDGGARLDARAQAAWWSVREARERGGGGGEGRRCLREGEGSTWRRREADAREKVTADKRDCSSGSSAFTETARFGGLQLSEPAS